MSVDGRSAFPLAAGDWKGVWRARRRGGVQRLGVLIWILLRNGGHDGRSMGRQQPNSDASKKEISIRNRGQEFEWPVRKRSVLQLMWQKWFKIISRK